MKGFPDERHIYNKTSQPWTVRCESDQVALDGGRSHAVVGANANLGLSFIRLGKDGKVPKDVQMRWTGEYRSWAYYLGRARVTITNNDGDSGTFDLLLVGDNTKPYHGWTPVYKSDHGFANKNWKGEQLYGDLCITAKFQTGGYIGMGERGVR